MFFFVACRCVVTLRLKDGQVLKCDLGYGHPSKHRSAEATEGIYSWS